MNIKHILIGCVIGLSMQSGASDLTLSGLAACQRQPQNGMVDILVTFTGESNDVALAECSFAATNNETKCAVPVEQITCNLGASGADGVWTRKFVWDAQNDVGRVKIDDVALTVKVTIPDGVGGVQLWENGPYWAECNVGAKKPEESGYYFWWGDTVGYKRNANNNGWISVKDSSSFSFSSENCPTYGKNDSQLQLDGYIDAMGNLVAEHDAATAYLGVPWRMPTTAEFLALRSNCDTEWTTRNGVSGRLVKGRGTYASKSIFFPAAASGSYSSISGTAYGYYLSSTSTSHPDYSEYLFVYFNNGFPTLDVTADRRFYGQSVRPMREGSETGTVVGSTTVHLQVNFRTDDGGEIPGIECPGDEEIPEIEWSYVIRDGEAMIFNGGKCAIPVGTTGAVVVPAVLGGCPVTKIGGYAFYGCSELTSVTIPHEVIEIGSCAFGCCSNLVSITGIGDNVLQVGEGAFSGCSKITSMYIPSNLKNIPSSLFRGCKSLERVVMGNDVTNIEEQAFSGCVSLSDMKLSSTLVSIGEWAFSGCPIAFPLPASVRKIDWHIFSAPVDELVLDGCVTKDMEWPFTRREVGTYYDQDPYNGHYYRDYSKDVASGVLKIFEWNDTGENFHLTLEDSWSLYYTDVSITPFRTGREYHEWSPPIVYRRDAEISIVPAARSVIQGRTAISLLAPHEDVELFYTIDGSDPRTNGIKYEQKFSIRGKTTVRAVGYYNGKLTTRELVAKYGSGEVSTPEITSSQPKFNFSGNQIAITCATSGVEIHYTTDGSEPTADSPLYSAPFCIDETTMIKAIAVGHAEYMDSLIAVREFKREWLTVPTPVVSPGDGGSFDTVRGVVTIACPLSAAIIYYTTDGTKPTMQSPVYSGPFEIDSDTVVRAFAVKTDYLDSAFVKATIYNRQPFAATPVISLAGGGNSFVGSKGVVSIVCATDGAVFHYTLDGSTPTAESPVYMEPFGIAETTTVKAFASKLGCRDSEVVSATFEKQWAYGDSLDCPDLMFANEGGDWVNDPNVSYDGKGSLRSPLNPQDGKEYSFSTEVASSQSVSFYWKTSCEKDEWDEFFYDHAEFWVDDVLVAQLDGREDDWQFVFCPIERDCAHVLSWVYVKDGSGAMGDDCVWIDYLKLDEERADCEVFFDPRDGSGNVTKKIYQIGSRLGNLDTPTRTGYDFVGWFYNGVQVTSSTIVSGDMTLDGRWVTSRTWSYSKVKGGIEITGVKPATGDLIIPNQIDGFDVVGIGEKAFYKCGDLTSVTIPEKVVTISRYAFWQCTGLKSVNVLSLSNWCQISLRVPEYGPLYYAQELLHNGVRVEKLIVPSDVTEIGDCAFCNCTGLTSVVVTPNVRNVGYHAFKGCSGMVALEVQNGVTNIEMGAFTECSSLRVAKLPDGANVQDRAFAMCSQLQKVVLPSDLKEISTRVFAGCSSLVDVKIPDCVQKIGDSSFMDCAFRSLTIPNGVTDIAQFAFGYCQLESIVIPSTVRTIGRYAFEECPRLEFVDLGEGVESLGDDVFFRCPLLRAIVVHRSLTTVGVGVFSLCRGMKTVYVEDADGERVEGVLDRTGFEDPVSYVELSKAIPPLDCVPMGAKVSDIVAGFGDPRLKDNICNEEEYSLYRDWAVNVAGGGSGLAMVRESWNSWTSYALDLDMLLTSDLKAEDIKIMDLKQQQGTDGFNIVFGISDVAIGERASADNLKKIFEIEGTESLETDGFSSANVMFEFDKPEAGKMKVKARPHGKPSAFFMRIGLKN